jgi:hypothetical protein
MDSELAVALDAESPPDQMPTGLPLAHLTAQRRLESILKVGCLKPQLCTVFYKELLYFSYGGVFYRTSNMRTQHCTELPVALVFSPELLKVISRLFPFHSGAVAAGLYGPKWSRKLSSFSSRFSINTKDACRDAGRLVYHLFDTNRRYLEGIPSSTAEFKHDPLPLLHQFQAAVLSSVNVNHRNRAIEAISEVSVELGRQLLWIGIPEWKTSAVLKELYRWTKPSVPLCYTYHFARNTNPSEIASCLEENAYRDVIKQYANLS